MLARPVTLPAYDAMTFGIKRLPGSSIYAAALLIVWWGFVWSVALATAQLGQHAFGPGVALLLSFFLAVPFIPFFIFEAYARTTRIHIEGGTLIRTSFWHEQHIRLSEVLHVRHWPLFGPQTIETPTASVSIPYFLSGRARLLGILGQHAPMLAQDGEPPLLVPCKTHPSWNFQQSLLVFGPFAALIWCWLILAFWAMILGPIVWPPAPLLLNIYVPICLPYLLLLMYPRACTFLPDRILVRGWLSTREFPASGIRDILLQRRSRLFHPALGKLVLLMRDGRHITIPQATPEASLAPLHDLLRAQYLGREPD